MGVKVMETNQETSTPTVTTTAKEEKNWPIMPPRKITGTKIETSDKVAASTGNTTSAVP